MVGVEREGEEGNEVRREERVYSRTGSQRDRGEDRGERHSCTRHRRHTLPRKEGKKTLSGKICVVYVHVCVCVCCSVCMCVCMLNQLAKGFE